MRLPGQSNKPGFPGCTYNTLFLSISKYYNIIWLDDLIDIEQLFEGY